MREELFVHILSLLTGPGFIALGINFRTKKDQAVQPWANIKEPPKVTDIVKYNKAMGNLFILYGLLLFTTMTLMNFSDLWALVSVVVIMLLSIALMIAMVFVQNKYRA